MSTLVVFRRGVRRLPPIRRSSPEAELPNIAGLLHKPQLGSGMGSTVRFCRGVHVTEVINEMYTRANDGIIFRVRDAKYVQGQWMLIFTNYTDQPTSRWGEVFVHHSEPMWGDKWGLGDDDLNDPVHRLHLLESGGGEVLAVWREPSGSSLNWYECWNFSSGILRDGIDDEGYRVARTVFDQHTQTWVAYLDSSGTEYGEWITYARSATELKIRIMDGCATAREDGTFWHVVAISCNTTRQWVAVLHSNWMNRDYSHNSSTSFVTKESIQVLENDPAGTQLQAEMTRLLEKDEGYRLRYVAHDGVHTLMIAQVSKSSHTYEDSMHIVNSSEALRELVHSYLERSLTLHADWEVALAVDLHVGINAASAIDARRCVVCMEREKRVVLLPYKHRCMCQECTDRIVAHGCDHAKCPMCRRLIVDTLEPFD